MSLTELFSSFQVQLLSFSPSMKGQEADSHRYGIFGQQPPQIPTSSSSHRENKENMPEVSPAAEQWNLVFTSSRICLSDSLPWKRHCIIQLKIEFNNTFMEPNKYGIKFKLHRRKVCKTFLEKKELLCKNHKHSDSGPFHCFFKLIHSFSVFFSGGL